MFGDRRRALIGNYIPPVVKAFPSAVGFGKDSTGGRGGQVIKVTNLNSSGSGSLREAVATSGARIIVFDIGGTIDLGGVNLDLTGDNCYIAGQTAPGDGILITGGMLTINSSNNIIRYMRFRLGDNNPINADSVAISAFGSQVLTDNIIDHCSISWADDENLNIRGAGTNSRVRNVTIQNCIISENNYALLHSPGAFDISYYNNLFIFNTERNPRVQGFSDTEFAMEFINNLIYGYTWAASVSEGCKYSVIGNHFKDSSGVSRIDTNGVSHVADGLGTLSDSEAYIIDNILPSGVIPYPASMNPYIVGTPTKTSDIVPSASSTVESKIIGDVGCSFPVRDAVDIRLINNYNAGNGSRDLTETYPTINNGTPATDTNGDGMPDSWKISKGFGVSDDLTSYVWPSGYVGIEEYINELV